MVASHLAGRNDPYGTGQFRRYDRFQEQWKKGQPIPQVVFIEPKYTDDPTFSFHPRNDDHCPTGITEGQRLLANIYNTLISNNELWKSVALIVTYDEHGGFFDHVPPPPAPVHVGGINFATAGVRVPAFVISPYVKQGGIFSGVVDHTAFLQLLADRFTPGKEYSPAVSARQSYFQKLAPIFDNKRRTGAPPKIPQSALDDMLTGAPAMALKQDTSNTKIALDLASAKMASLHSDRFAVT
jgi:phospholipase C